MLFVSTIYNLHSSITVNFEKKRLQLHNIYLVFFLALTTLIFFFYVKDEEHKAVKRSSSALWQMLWRPLSSSGADPCLLLGRHMSQPLWFHLPYVQGRRASAPVSKGDGPLPQCPLWLPLNDAAPQAGRAPGGLSCQHSLLLPGVEPLARLWDRHDLL